MNAFFFAVVLVALGLLFAGGLRVPVGRPGWPRWLARSLLVIGAAAATILANVALFRHDIHLDLTASRAFSPSPETGRLARALEQDVDLTYFFQKQDPAAQAFKTVLEVLGREAPRFHVRVVDPDQFPSLASRYGVRSYNVAVLESGGRRVQVTTTSDQELALGLVRVTRAEARTVCFATGHAEYDIDNFEYHTHFEGAQGHSHTAEGARVVLMEQHGFGRVRRALESLGIGTRKLSLAAAGRVPPDCTAVVEAGPRTRHAPPEVDAFATYLASGGSVLLLLDLEAPIEARLATLLGQVGLGVGDGVIVDPRDHYFTDDQMVTVSAYGAHRITRDLALSFYPGARPLVLETAPDGVTLSPLLASSPESHVRPLTASPRDERAQGSRGARVFGAAAEGFWPGSHGAGRPFRLVVVGDADFASNSFFPYMSNADFALSALSWLLREEKVPTTKPPVEVLPRVVLTSRQVAGIFVAIVVILPGLSVLSGGILWWRRRR